MTTDVLENATIFRFRLCLRFFSTAAYRVDLYLPLLPGLDTYRPSRAATCDHQIKINKVSSFLKRTYRLIFNVGQYKAMSWQGSVL